MISRGGSTGPVDESFGVDVRSESDDRIRVKRGREAVETLKPSWELGGDGSSS
jgi:hypothetical protein